MKFALGMFCEQKKCTRDVILKTFKETNNKKINKFKVLFKLFIFFFLISCFDSKDLYYSSSPPSAFLKNLFSLAVFLLFWNSHLVTSKLVHFFSTHNKTHEGTHKRMNQKKFKIRDTFFLGDSSQNVQQKTAIRSFFLLLLLLLLLFFIYFIWNAI